MIVTVEDLRTYFFLLILNLELIEQIKLSDLSL